MKPGRGRLHIKDHRNPKRKTKGGYVDEDTMANFAPAAWSRNGCQNNQILGQMNATMIRRTTGGDWAGGLPRRWPPQGIAEPHRHKPSALAEPRVPTEDELEAIHRQSAALQTAEPEEIIRWAVDNYFPKLAMATAFGPEGCVILSMLAKIEPRVYVFNLDTGYQFKQTLETRDRITQQYGIVVDERKLKVLYRVTQGFDAWMSGIRRDQSRHRAEAPIVGWDGKFGLMKINPLANWTKGDVWKRISEEKVPYNPLHDQGYPSVGCWPCTRAITEGEDERAGRWSGTARTECGLHTKEE